LLLLAMALLFVDVRVVPRADEHLASQPVRLRIMWGGRRRTGGRAASRRWRLACNGIALRALTPTRRVDLVRRQQIHVESLSPHLVRRRRCDRDADFPPKLLIMLKNGLDATPVQAEVPLAKVLSEPFHLPLDARK
jgi:hypothetical protein